MTTSYTGGSSGADMGRDRSRKLFGVTDDSPTWQRVTHDSAYWGTFNFVTSFPGYIVGGLGPKELVLASAFQGLVGIINGFQMWWGNDIALYLAGMKEKCNRKLPESIKKMAPRAKKSALALATATSLALCAGTYKIAEYEHSIGNLNYNNELFSTKTGQGEAAREYKESMPIYFTDSIKPEEDNYSARHKFF